MTDAEKVYLAEKQEAGVSLGYMRLATIASAAVACAAICGLLWAVASSGQRHAYIVRIEPNGQYEAVAEGVMFRRQPQEVGWFIRQFCASYFSRDRLTIQELPKTLFYFAPNVRDEIQSAWRQARVIENVVGNQSEIQVDAVATNVQLSRGGTEAYVQVRLDRRVNGQKADGSPVATTYIRFLCLACDGKKVPDEEVNNGNPLGFQVQNVPLLEAAK